MISNFITWSHTALSMSMYYQIGFHPSQVYRLINFFPAKRLLHKCEIISTTHGKKIKKLSNLSCLVYFWVKWIFNVWYPYLYIPKNDFSAKRMKWKTTEVAFKTSIRENNYMCPSYGYQRVLNSMNLRSMKSDVDCMMLPRKSQSHNTFSWIQKSKHFDLNWKFSYPIKMNIPCKATLLNVWFFIKYVCLLVIK